MKLREKILTPVANSAEVMVSRRVKKVFGKAVPAGQRHGSGRTWAGIRAGKVTSNGQRVHAIKLPPLDVARALFAEHVGEVAWSDEDDEGALG